MRDARVDYPELVLRPSQADVLGTPFEEYISRHETRIIKAGGVCKIVMPLSVQPRRSGYGESIDQLLISRAIRQHATGGKGIYRMVYVEQKPMRVAEFKAVALDRHNLPTSSGEGRSGNTDDADLERKFWKNVGIRPPLYGADVEGSLFDEKAKGWNLRHLDTLLSTVLTESGYKLPGVNTPYLYFGAWRSVFAWHTEDLDLYSVNYLHFGAPKQWYVIPLEHRQRFEYVVKTQVPELFKTCPEFLRHKELLLSPQFLEQFQIPYVKVVQRPREFVITFPGAYHAGFNQGFNCAESVNFATKRWVPIGARAGVCHCHKDAVRIDMRLFRHLVPARQLPEELLVDTSDEEEDGEEEEEEEGSDEGLGSSEDGRGESEEEEEEEEEEREERSDVSDSTTEDVVGARRRRPRGGTGALGAGVSSPLQNSTRPRRRTATTTTTTTSTRAAQQQQQQQRHRRKRTRRHDSDEEEEEEEEEEEGDEEEEGHDDDQEEEEERDGGARRGGTKRQRLSQPHKDTPAKRRSTIDAARAEQQAQQASRSQLLAQQAERRQQRAAARTGGRLSVRERVRLRAGGATAPSRRRDGVAAGEGVQRARAARQLPSLRPRAPAQAAPAHHAPSSNSRPEVTEALAGAEVAEQSGGRVAQAQRTAGAPPAAALTADLSNSSEGTTHGSGGHPVTQSEQPVHLHADGQQRQAQHHQPALPSPTEVAAPRPRRANAGVNKSWRVQDLDEVAGAGGSAGGGEQQGLLQGGGDRKSWWSLRGAAAAALTRGGGTGGAAGRR